MFLFLVNEDDGCQLVEDAVRDVYFPPVRALYLPMPASCSGQPHNDTAERDIKINYLTIILN